MKEITMKLFQIIRNSIFLGGLALGTLFVLAPSLALAEGKGASKLMLNASSSQSQSQTVAAKPSAMLCGLCTDGYTKVPDTSAKGMRAGSLKTVAVHMCPACQTRIVSVGTGKTRTDKVAHTCGNDRTAEATCCVTAR
jgi:hypothetical protein